MRIMRWAGHIARMGRIEVYTGFWCRNLKERDHLEDPGLDGENNIKMDLHEAEWGALIGLI